MSPTKTTTSSRPPDGIPIAVWPNSQVTTRLRSKEPHSSGSTRTTTVVSGLVRRIIEEYSEPGDLVVDPMAGSGSTLIEAARLDRRSIGIESDPLAFELATIELDRALSANQRQHTSIARGNACRLEALLAEDNGNVDLVFISSRSTRNDRTTDDYGACLRVLKPGGLLITVAKNTRKRNALVDDASRIVECARGAGFIYLQHVVSLLCDIRDGDLVGLPSPSETRRLKASHRQGVPLHLVAHENVLVFRSPEAGANV